MSAKMRRREAPAASATALSLARWHRPAIEVALVILVALAFSNSFQAGFTLDNHGWLRDPRVQQATAHNLRLIADHTYWWPSGEAGLYRPLTTLTYLFNYAILGDAEQPAGYHWVNLALHAINVLLAFALLLRLTGELRTAGLIAAVWGGYPGFTEAGANFGGSAGFVVGGATRGRAMRRSAASSYTCTPQTRRDGSASRGCCA